MPSRFSHLLRLPGLLLLFSLLCGCTLGNSLSTSPPTRPTTATTLASTSSTAHFIFSGGHSGSYTLQTSTTASELRHGHREFTIQLNSTYVSLFIAFYGYKGPGNYTLTDAVNGGDLHIGLQNNMISWDLLMQPEAHCTLTVVSDTPLGNTGMDRMIGSFGCPLLLSSSPDHPQKPVTVSSGSFNIAILVAS